MKYAVIWAILILIAGGCNRNRVMSKLLREQQLLKDSANNLNESIGDYLHKSVYDSADMQGKHLNAVHARLVAIQFSIDSLVKMK